MKGKPALVLAAVTILWGSTFVVTKDLMRDTPPLAYLALRFALGAATLGLVLMLTRSRTGRTRVDSAMFTNGIVLALLNSSGLLLQVIGQAYTTASKSSFITSVSVPLTPVCALALYRARPTKPQKVAVVLATLGLGLLTYPGGQARYNPGDLCTFGCAVVFAFTIVEMTRRSPGRDALAFASVQVGSAALFFAVLGVGAQLLARVWHTPILVLEARPLSLSPQLVLEIVYMGVVCTAVTFAAQTWAMARMTATAAAIVFALEPVFATLMAISLWGSAEWPSARGSVGAALVLIAVAVAEIRLPGPRQVE